VPPIARALLAAALLWGTGAARAADVELRWTAPGDNGSSGTAAGYDLRFRSIPPGADTLSWWNAASEVQGEPTPGPAGATQSVVVGGLTPGASLTFLLRTFDEALNLSPFSNVLTINVPDVSDPHDPPPTPSLEIRNARVDSIGTKTALVRWETEPGAFGFVRHGSSASYSLVTAPGPDTTRTHSVLLTGLAEGSTVHFQIVAYTGAERDSTGDSSFVLLNLPPARIGNLAAAPGPNSGEARLTWTAVGDDSLAGQASSYDLRWSRSPISGANWIQATRLTTFAPLPSGSPENRVFGWLPAGETCYFALRARDLAGNESALSNLASVALPADTVAPILSNIHVQNITPTSARIAWSTNEAADGEVRYGKTVAYELGSIGESARVTTHLLTLSGLEPTTVYHFQVRSADAAGNLAVSEDRAFQTGTPVPSEDPVLSGLALAALSDTDAVVVFSTNVPAFGRIDFGLDTTYGTTVAGTEEATEHSFRLAPLTPGETYHFRARATTSSGGAASSADQTLTTHSDSEGPSIDQVEVAAVGPTSATIRWKTDEASIGRIEYGLTPSYGSFSSSGAAYAYQHERTLEGLAPGSLFHFRVRSSDPWGNESSSENHTFATLATGDHEAPVISGLQVEGTTETCATIVWETSEPADAQIEYGLSLPYALATPLAEALVTAHRLTFCGLLPGTTYHFRVLSRDASGNLAASGDALFTTIEGEEPALPAISGVLLKERTSTGVTVAWETDRPAVGQIEYGPAPSFGAFSAPETSPREDHAVRIEGIVPSVVFHFRVLSWVTGGPTAFSAPDTFLLAPEVDLDPPVISGVAVAAVTDSSAEIEWTTDEPADGRVEYGSGAAYDRATALDTTRTTSHRARLEGLLPATTYRFRVLSTDRAGNLAFSIGEPFTTEGLVDTTAPRVDGFAVQELGGGSIRATWSSDEPARGSLRYGLDSTVSLSTTPSTGLVVLHQADVHGLATGARFYFQAAGMDAAGNEGRSSIVALVVGAAADTIPPRVAGELHVRAGIRDAVLLWATEEPTNSLVEYGPDTTFGYSAEEEGYHLTHAFTLTGLAADAVYHFRITSRDAAGNRAVWGGNTFATLTDTGAVAPVVLSWSLMEIGSSHAVIAWSTDRLSIGQIEYGTGGVWTRATPFSRAFATSHQDTLRNLQASTVYSYRVRGLSPEGLFFAAPPASFRTAEDLAPPPPPAFRTAVEAEGAIRLFWEADPSETPHTVILHRRFLPGGQWTTVWVASGKDTVYVDVLPAELGTYRKAEYCLEAFDAYGNRSRGETIEVELPATAAEGVPAFRLLPNRPNPFNPTTAIPFEIPSTPSASHRVRIAVYNAAGEMVRLLLDEGFPAGTTGEVLWDGSDYRGNPVASGIYYCRFDAGSYRETRRMTLIR
jgi:chitodextrinase